MTATFHQTHNHKIIQQLAKHGWVYLKESSGKDGAYTKYLMLRPGATEPEWVKIGAMKAVIKHLL